MADDEELEQDPIPVYRPIKLPPRAIKRFDKIGDTNEAAAEILWVYHHMNDDPPDPLACPSRGAWNLLELSREQGQAWFVEKMYRPICGEMAKKKTELAEAGLTKREKYCRAEIDKMLDEAIAASQG